MNGSNHLGELEAAIGFDVQARDRALRDLAREAGFDDEASWLDSELRMLETAIGVR
jgi:hypothetical protein